MKRLLVVLVIFTFFIPQNLFAKKVEVDGIIYVLKYNGTAEVGEQEWKFCEGSDLCITIPSTICYEDKTYTVTKIGDFAFPHSWGVVRFELPETITSIGRHAFAESGNLENINLPEGLLSLGEYAFYDCKKLKTVDLPSSLVSIGNGCFWHCYKITNISIPEGVSIIPDQCFYCCVNLREINLPDGIVNIGEMAFCGLRMQEFTLPASVVSIGNLALSSTSLIRLYVHAIEPPILEGNVFGGVPLHRGRLFVPAGSEEAYREAEGWGKWWKILPIEEDPNSIDKAELSADSPTEVYNINGTRLDTPQRGINILRSKEGKTIKVMK